MNEKCGGIVDLIDLSTGLSVMRLTFPGKVRNTPDGCHLVVANGNSTIYVVRLAKPQ